MTSPITLGGFTTNGAISDTATIAPFSAVTVSDSILGDQVSATISFTAANGTLNGSGLSAGVVSNGTVTYSLSATTPAALQAELQALTFAPAAHQGAAGSPVTTAFDLTVSDVTASPPTTPSATLTSGVSSPISVVTDAAGDVFVGNKYTGTVEEFRSGRFTLIWRLGAHLRGTMMDRKPAGAGPKNRGRSDHAAHAPRDGGGRGAGGGGPPVALADRADLRVRLPARRNFLSLPQGRPPRRPFLRRRASRPCSAGPGGRRSWVPGASSADARGMLRFGENLMA